ncbi:MAG: dTDP-4-dehydrorhamnose 3,5-epimerase [Betaproteobacteria bacterium]|nr:dTDP-4-dehydrorhamnose 3,5-epimerase [Betaproteobacteria bacterium]
MNVIKTGLADVLILEPRVFGDERGFFFESYNEREFIVRTGIEARFVQDNHSKSARNVLRGLHYQIRQPQGKLVRVTCGEVYDVAVDIRRRSPTFGKWTACVLSADNKRMLWIPAGLAHGFLVMSPSAEVQYKTTDYWAPEHERCIAWNDPALNIPWPLQGTPVLSSKDRQGLNLDQAEVFP